MTAVETPATLAADFATEVRTRLDRIAALAEDGGLDDAITLLTEAIQAGAVIQAFGTGHHATTQGCLAALDRLARRGARLRRMADIGGGTGVLAMAAASVWPLRAMAGDIDPVATMTAREKPSPQ